MLQYDRSKDLLMGIRSQYGGVSVHHRWSQIATVRAMTITIDSLLLKMKFGCDGGYDVAVKGLNIVVRNNFLP